MSRWERDPVYPTWPQQPRIIDYLGYDPFTDPELGRLKSNETTVVAFLTLDGNESYGLTLRKHRLELKKTKKEFARELGVDVKTLRAWDLSPGTFAIRISRVHFSTHEV